MFTWFSKKDRKIANLEAMVKNRDKLIERMQITLRSLMADKRKVEEKAKSRITDLENNIEILVNNLSAAKKKQLGL